MKDLRGQASQEVHVAQESVLALLADVEGYPRWYPEVVRDIEVVQRDGDWVTRAHATLFASVGPIRRELQLLLSVTREADTVRLVRVPHERTDRERFEVTWRAVATGARTQLQLALAASLDVPRLLPTGGLADTMASGFVVAAARELSTGA